MVDHAESTAPVEATEVDSEVSPAQSEGSAPSGTEAAASGDDTSNWTQKAQQRYNELTEARYKESARADRESYRREQLEREIAELRRQQEAKPQQVAPADEYPTRESVGFDEAAYDRAVDAYYAKHIESRATEAAKRALAAEREAEQRRQANQAWDRKEAEFIKSKPDYAEKVIGALRRSEFAMTPEMSNAITLSDDGPGIAYYLADNREKAAAIAQLPPGLQAIEIGRIAGRLEAIKANAPPPVSKAPPPVQAIGSAAAPSKVSTTDPESDKQMSDDEWYRAELKRVARKAARK